MMMYHRVMNWITQVSEVTGCEIYWPGFDSYLLSGAVDKNAEG